MLKAISSITNAIGAVNYQGTWNASVNSPALASGVGTKGDYYVVSTAGSTNLDGLTTWYVGDWAVFNGSVWQRLEGGSDDPAPSLKSNSTTGLMQITGPAAGQTRVVTIPDANATMARTDAAQSFTGNQTLSTGDLLVATADKGMKGTTGTRGVIVTSTGSRQLGSVDALHANQSYTKAEVIYTNSNFNNPVLSLLTYAFTGAGTQNGSLLAKITVYQQGWGFGGMNIHQGFAQINCNGAGGYSAGQVSVMTVVQNFGTANVGTLSWSGQTLQYTCNRASNYDTYTIVIEVGLSGTNMQTQGATVTFGTLS